MHIYIYIYNLHQRNVRAQDWRDPPPNLWGGLCWRSRRSTGLLAADREAAGDAGDPRASLDLESVQNHRALIATSNNMCIYIYDIYIYIYIYVYTYIL